MSAPLLRYGARDWRGKTWLIERTQSGDGVPTKHSKRLKQKRKQGRRSA